MTKIKTALTVISMALAAGFAAAQTSRQRIAPAGPAASARPCLLTGSYRIDVVDSDKLYSVVKDATSTDSIQPAAAVLYGPLDSSDAAGSACDRM